MQNSDLQAIREFNPTEHKYLSIKKENGKECLEVKKMNWLGRIWMWLGFSNASIKKIHNYIERNQETFQKMERADKIKLFQKVKKYKLQENYYIKLFPLVYSKQYEKADKVLEELEIIQHPFYEIYKKDTNAIKDASSRRF